MVPNFHVVNALVPVADAFDTANDTDIIDAGVGDGVLFIMISGAVSGAAVNTITVEASSNIAAGAVATVPFVYRTCVATDVWGAWTAATATGFSFNNSVANSMFQVYVDSAEIAEEGYRYVRLSTDETANFTVTAGIVGIVVNPRYGPTTTSALD
jgi:hypothetical protein